VALVAAGRDLVAVTAYVSHFVMIYWHLMVRAALQIIQLEIGKTF
jgi:hypothetical protein